MKDFLFVVMWVVLVLGCVNAVYLNYKLRERRVLGREWLHLIWLYRFNRRKR